MSQFLVGSVTVSAVSVNREFSWMPMLRSCACMIWNASSLSWLPDVDQKSNSRRPTPGHE
jgi:hypothetical protein